MLQLNIVVDSGRVLIKRYGTVYREIKWSIEKATEDTSTWYELYVDGQRVMQGQMLSEMMDYLKGLE